jgi:hypothetical protein
MRNLEITMETLGDLKWKIFNINVLIINTILHIILVGSIKKSTILLSNTKNYDTKKQKKNVLILFN